VPQIVHPQAESAAWWFRDGRRAGGRRGAMSGQAKNVILFVGDGMSLTTVAAARILDGSARAGPARRTASAGKLSPPPP
jgi:alkaline phosphatase